MNKCIFCGLENVQTKSEHIIPASFAGEDSYILDKGYVCDKCNNYFSHAFENEALNDFPFNFISLFYSVPNRSGKSRKIATHIGIIESTNILGRISLIPNENYSSNSSKLYLLSDPLKPLAVCRLLAKIGFEYLCYHHPELIWDIDYNDIRDFIRKPKIGCKWSFSISDHDIVKYNINNNIVPTPIETILVGDDKKPTLFGIKIYSLQILIPLVKHLQNKETDIYNENKRVYFVEVKR
jgi:hypothetical protein